MKFRLDINGLRALAVFTVVIFHFDPTWMQGGFVGVDVFFVISGFLMTKIIFDRLDKAQFSLLEFYLARAKRIIPALTIMLLVVTIYCWNVLYDVEFQKYLKHLFSSLLFYSNVVYWQEAGYFSASAHENYLLHTWSLSVEWQFYVVYPIFIAVLARLLTRTIIKILILLGALASFVLGVYATDIWPDPAYFSLPTRAWQMLAGAIVFLYPLPKRLQHSSMSLLGILLITFSAFAFSSDYGWPGVYAAVPIIGAMLVIANPQSASLRLFNLNAVENTGKWSYSIYLWHWPIVVFLHNQNFAVQWFHNVLGIVCSFILGFLSYKFIECSRLYYAKFAVFASTVLFANSISPFATGSDSSIRAKSADPSNQLIQKYSQDRNNAARSESRESCRLSVHLKSNDEYVLPEHCVSKNEGIRGVLIWGDSHAEAIAAGFESFLKARTSVDTVISSGCRPTVTQTVGNASKLRKACDLSNSLAKDIIAAKKPLSVVIAMKNKHEIVDWPGNIEFLKRNGVENIIVIGPTPQWYPTVPLVYVREGGQGEFLSDKKLDPGVLSTDRKMANTLASFDSVTYVSVIKELCVAEEDSRRCKVKFDDTLISYDYGHLSKPAATYLSEELLFDLFDYESISVSH
ncbi:acyltransferase family protein [Alteromonas oceani]|uniref:Acyltransferase family protein n=1 Tax=Alteromonas oceani TaxID=2071609 RepID=A0ABV7JZ55_9ALTE|nr:acyltransferase family protein [Alteromonas oceani]